MTDNNGMTTIEFLTGIHSEPKDHWISSVYNNMQNILNVSSMTERKRILDNLASKIKGIGPATVEETLAIIELTLYSKDQGR